jgi:hypothetical protein
MELKEVFRPGWRMIVACVAILAGPLSVVQNFWIAHLVLSGRPVPASLGAFPIYSLPAVAVIALTSLYFGEIGRTRELERRLGIHPSHRIYVREAPSTIVDRLGKADWKELRHLFRSHYRGRWIQGVAIIGRMSAQYGRVFVYLRDDSAGVFQLWGMIEFLGWTTSAIDQLKEGDRVNYEGRIAGFSMGYLELRRPTLTIIEAKQ